MMKRYKTAAASFVRIPVCRLALLLGCSLVYLPVSALAQDSVVQETVSAVPEESTTDNNVYKDPDYFKDIPVAHKSVKAADEAKQSFQEIKERYSLPEFDYTDNRTNRLSWWQRLSRRIGDFLGNLIPDLNWNLGQAFYYLLVGLGLAALIYIIFKLTGSGKRLGYKEDRSPGEEHPEWIEQQLTELDLQTYLDQALADRDFMLAVRYLHLTNLKKLAATGQIEWDYKKTNHELLQELKDQSLSTSFAQTIRVYEYIWYGRFAVKEQQFKDYQQLFHHFNRAIA